MNELTDLEICQSIAEIEGRVISGVGSLNVFVKCEPSLIGNEQYDPLTDDALWVQLIDKYNVSINTHPWNSSVKQCYIIKQVKSKMIIGQTFSINDLGLKKAACLAIIDSKE
jgi:hypothetical protein